MAKLKEKSKLLTSEIVDIPAPVKNAYTERIKLEISELPLGKCLKYDITEEMNLIKWQRFISTICTNYTRKLNGLVKFTIKSIDKESVGVWRIK